MDENLEYILKTLNDNSTYLGNGIIKLDSILDHQIDPYFIDVIGQIIAEKFSKIKYPEITKIVTAEASGIAPAFAVARILNIPLIYARKNLPLTMSSNHASFNVKSRTKDKETPLYISKEYLNDKDYVLIVDDILGTGGALNALITLVTNCKAKTLAASCIIEKTFENARENFPQDEIEIFSVVKAELKNNCLVFK